jgi:6-phosphogluconolactonase
MAFLFFRAFLVGAAVALLMLPAVLFSAVPAKEAKPDKLWVYVGTYNKRGSKGIYRFELDLSTGKLTNRALAAESPDPSFLAIDPSQRYVYSVNEINKFDGKKSGAVSAFAIDPKTGDLKLLNQQASEGTGPCHVVVDAAGKHVLAANYSGGNACVLPVEADGKLGKATGFVQHQGSGADPRRQKEPHAHSINLDAANRFAFVADLGLDKVLVYRFDPAKGTITPNDPPAATVAPGSGPRHFAFHPNGRNAYVINEMKNTVTAFSYNPERGVLKELQTVPTLPKDFKGNSSTAEVVVHPSGKFLYGSNRGHNSIVIFSIDPKSGELTLVGHQASQIKTPRNFAIDPTGAYLLVANQDGDSIVVFRIDPKTGELKPTGNVAEVPAPVCLRMMPMKH